MLMVRPLLTVGDFRAGLSDEVADAGELLRNYPATPNSHAEKWRDASRGV